MTNHWIDFQNSDCILIMGSNPASNHPVSFKWITKAVEKGAMLICVDPRFTQSAAKSHIYAPLRSGTDIAFLGGMIKYILDNNLIQEEYVKNYTNASFLVNPSLKLPGENNGVFSGLKGDAYDKTTWSYQSDAGGRIKKDVSLNDPDCVYQLLKKHYSRYTPELVSRITGTPREKLMEVYREYSKTGRPDKAGNILYAMGWTQHTVGTQNIRTMAIIQLLLGNTGIAGGGVQALRGESNVQGSTDYGLLFHILPGYLGTPAASHTSLAVYNEKRTPKTGEPNSLNWWKNFPKYSASLLRAFYGTNATLEEAYSYLPKVDDGVNYSWLALFDQMYKGKFSGFFAWGMNPSVSGANTLKVNKAMANLDWMVNVNLFDNETGSFWRGPGMDPKKNKNGSIHAALRLFLREGRKHHQQRPTDAVAVQGRRTARRGQARCRHHYGTIFPHQGVIRKRRRPRERCRYQTDMELRRLDYRRPSGPYRHSCRGQGNQRIFPGRQGRSGKQKGLQEGRTRSFLCLPAG
jgi:formate dehydrogenase major subunit